MSYFSDALQFAIPCWAINLSLNSLYVIKTVYPPLARYDYPLDGKLKLRDNRRILGNSTTWPGVAIALAAGILLSFVFSFSVTAGILYGISVYAGHGLGSFIKRRFGYSDGKFMPFVDHSDYVILTGAIMGLLGKFSWHSIIIAILITYIVHPIVTFLGYLLKLHKYPL